MRRNQIFTSLHHVSICDEKRPALSTCSLLFCNIQQSTKSRQKNGREVFGFAHQLMLKAEIGQNDWGAT